MRMLLAAAALLVSTSLAYAAMTDAECEAAWEKSDANNDGMVTEAEASQNYAAMRVAEKMVLDGKLSRADFLTHCKVGVYDYGMRALDHPGAPLAGANSFIEAPARDRAMATGAMNVSARSTTMASDAGRRVAMAKPSNCV